MYRKREQWHSFDNWSNTPFHRKHGVCYNSSLLGRSRPSSSVGIATGYALEGPGIESRWGEIFRTCPVRSWGPPRLLYNRYRVFVGVKSGRGVTLTSASLLVPRSWKGRSIPLLPLLAVRPAQSLSACTRVHFNLPYLYCKWTTWSLKMTMIISFGWLK